MLVLDICCVDFIIVDNFVKFILIFIVVGYEVVNCVFYFINVSGEICGICLMCEDDNNIKVEGIIFGR